MEMLIERWKTFEREFQSRYPSHAGLYRRAVELVEEAHREQFRNNGLPYERHILDVVEILLEWEVEPPVILGGMLHDAVRYGRFTTFEALQQRLGNEEVASLIRMVDGIARHDDVARYARDNRRLQKIFDLMVQDVRAILVRCANRLANLRCLDAFTPEQRQQLLLSSTEVYLPLLDRLGMWNVRMEVEDCLFRMREPERYEALRQWSEREWTRREEQVAEWKRTLEQALIATGIEGAVVDVWRRPISAIQRQYLNSNPPDPGDLTRLDARHLFMTIVRVNQVEEAYQALAAIHMCGAPRMHSFRDYLAQPKTNGYAALHTSIVPNYGEPHHVYVRTHRLHEFAWRGILVGAVYDYWCTGNPPAEWTPAERRALDQFMSALRHGNRDRLLILTPRGDIVELPEGATVLDFAYEIHTDVGRQAGAALVNGMEVALHRELHSGDVVEIRKDLGRERPDPEWLDWVRTGKARENIQAQLRRAPVHVGRRRIDRALRQRGRTLDNYEGRLTVLASEMGSGDVDELFVNVAHGNLRARDIADRLLQPLPAERKTFRKVAVEPTDETRQRFPGWHPEMIISAACCAPQPGTPIAGYHTASGIELHEASCASLLDTSRVVSLRWKSGQVEARHVDFNLRATNRKGLIHDLTGAIRHASVDIVYLEGKRTGTEMDEINFTLEVANEMELANLINTIRALPNVTTLRVDGRTSDAAMVDLTPFLTSPHLIISPFSPGRPVAGEGRFWGREQEVRVIESFLSGPHAPSLLVQGPRRIGKTSLLQHLEHSKTLREQYRFAFVDLQSVAQSGAAEVLRLIANRLRRSLDSGRTVPLPGMEAFEADPLETFLGYLGSLTDLNRHARKRILLSLDEFGTLVESVRQGRLEFHIFSMLRSVMQHNPLVTMLLCTSDDVADMLQEEGVLELFNVTQKVRLQHLDVESAQRLIQQPLRGEVYFEPDAISALIRITDGHPYYLQILGANLISQLNREQRRTVFASDLEEVVRRHTHLNGSEFLHLWDRNSPEQLYVLQALCSPPAASALSPYRAVHVHRILERAGRTLTLDEVVRTLERLSRLETVQRTASPRGTVRYHVRVELFRRWLATHYPLESQGGRYAAHESLSESSPGQQG